MMIMNLISISWIGLSLSLLSIGAAFHPPSGIASKYIFSSRRTSHHRSTCQQLTEQQIEEESVACATTIANGVIPTRTNLPPPPCPKSDPNDDSFREVRDSWPLGLQHFLRESGILRSLEDVLILVGVPALIQQYPGVLSDFFHLSTSSAFMNDNDSSRTKSKLTNIQYGNHKMQFLDLIEPEQPNGVVAFVHGGAWGSGKPYMYRLVALPFLARNKAVAIIGYRTFPDAEVNGQVEDIGKALNALANERPDLLDENDKIDALIGHSSGAHISLLHVLEMAKKSIATTRGETWDDDDDVHIREFYGISGIYCIPSHFEHERGRGVDQLGALRPTCRDLEDSSPMYRLECMVGAEGEEECVLNDEETTSPITLDDFVPDMTFIHGVTDSVVAYTQMHGIVDSLQSTLQTCEKCNEVLLEDTGHADTIFEIMFGGKTQDALLEQICSLRK